jgi:serine/threonine protein kinase
MSLTSGTRLGSYEIVGVLGAGGMGEVYRARDTRLHREVALKILPDRFANDPARVSRFQREAQMVAALNHPNIAALYGLEETAGVCALVLELVDGLTLAERIRESVGAHLPAPTGVQRGEALGRRSQIGGGGALPLDEALAIARQIADALEAAHEKGIIHRDLKPGNVKLRPDGQVKLLDFGLAKLVGPSTSSGHDSDPRGEAVGSSASSPPWSSPTLSHPATETGLILGTAAYMSPEQARGSAIDTRSDIWSFGCVLYEMLTGCSAFPGTTVADMIASVLEREPDWQCLPVGTPEAVRRLMRRCLVKNPRRRLRDIGDARLEIEECLAGAVDPAGETHERRPARPNVGFQRLTDFSGPKSTPAISPDGKMVSFVAQVAGRRQVWIRMLAGGAALQVSRDDTDHEAPRWSPDSSTLIYGTPASGWSEQGALCEISALGGQPRRLISALAGADLSHDGRRLAALQLVGENVELVVAARDGRERECVISLPPEHLYSSPRWSPDDRAIAFQQGNSLNFDMRLRVLSLDDGRLVEVARSERLDGFSWLPDGSGLVYSSSRGSTLLYPPTMSLRRVRIDGREDHRITLGDVSYLHPDAHPSGNIVACRVRSLADIWRFPVGGSPQENTRDAVRVTRQTGQAQTPSVSPDGRELVYLSDNGGHGNLWVSQIDGSGVRQLTFERDPEVALGVPSWSPSGRWIAYIVTRSGHATLWLVRPDGSDPHEAAHGVFSAWSGDGEWLYYTPSGDGPHYLERILGDGGPAEVVVARPRPGVAVAADGSTLYFVHRPRSEIFGMWGDCEVRRGPHGDGPTELLARIAASRVPVARFLLQVYVSPDGQWLAMPLLDGATTNLWVLPAAGGPMRQLTDFGDRSILIGRSISWAADSQHIYAAVAETETDIVLLDGLLS